MADAAKDTYANLEKQIEDLKKELGTISQSLLSRASDAADQAEDNIHGLRDRASYAAKQVRDRAQVVAEAARENPGTAATVGGSVGLLGFLLGALVGGVVVASCRDR